MNILVLNSGSSSIKFSLYVMPEEKEVASGTIEKIGEEKADVTFSFSGDERKLIKSILDHSSGLKLVSDFVAENVLKEGSLDAIGHRVVHGGETYSRPRKVTSQILKEIEDLSVLAPLHNSSNAKGIRVSQQVFPKAEQVVVFDTAFHSTLPPNAYRYPIPNKLYEQHRIRVYGMHGTSHQYVAQQAAKHLNQPVEKLNAISAHLGNGCSMAAIKEGQSIDTSMGLSPLAGLMMGTRSGNIDPTIPYFLSEQTGMSPAEINRMLNHESGLKGVAGQNDLREVTKMSEQGDENAKLALEMYCYRIKKFIGSYLAALGKVDALIFTAGVGENSSIVRKKSLENLENLGITLDDAKNKKRVSGIREIQADSSLIKILVIPTNEELAIAQQTFQLLKNKSD